MSLSAEFEYLHCTAVRALSNMLDKVMLLAGQQEGHPACKN